MITTPKLAATMCAVLSLNALPALSAAERQQAENFQDFTQSVGNQTKDTVKPVIQSGAPFETINSGGLQTRHVLIGGSAILGLAALGLRRRGSKDTPKSERALKTARFRKSGPGDGYYA